MQTNYIINHFILLIHSELGMELMIQLTALTGIQFSSPTGIIGSYNHGKCNRTYL